VSVIADGDRRSYDVARGLLRAGALETMFADWYVSGPGGLDARFARLVGRLRPRLGQRMLERGHPELPPERVARNPVLGLWTELRRVGFRTWEEFWYWRAERIARWACRRGFGRSTGVYGYIQSTHPSVFVAAQRAGLSTVAEQMIAPVPVERCEVMAQQTRWPDWEPPPDTRGTARMAQWEADTWAALDRIVVPSEYVRDGVKSQGVPDEKIELVPYPSAALSLDAIDRRGRTGPVRVGFVGQLSLRKNIPVIFEVARRFNPAEVRFTLVGKPYIHQNVLDKHRGDVELAGFVPRQRVPELLGGFDIFFFPSVCEGSAGAVIEAMMTGLPIVTTPNSGSPVRDGIEGYLGRPDEVDLFEMRIRSLALDPDLRHMLGTAGRDRVSGLTLDWYGQELRAVFARLGGERQRTAGRDPS
jgi:glycosyltransferase involved in cell wall biosynthesis